MADNNIQSIGESFSFDLFCGQTMQVIIQGVDGEAKVLKDIKEAPNDYSIKVYVNRKSVKQSTWGS